MRYLDSATTRLTRRYESDFETMVEAVRVGTIVASDRAAFTRWQSIKGRRSAVAPGSSSGLSGAALERAIAGLAIQHPDLVART